MEPIPGDAGAIARGAADMVSAATRMQRAAETLGHLVAGHFTSKATDALKVNASDLQVSMVQASARYQGAGDALADFARQLPELQNRALSAIARSGATDVGSARSVRDGYALESFEANFNPLLPQEERDRISRNLEHAEQELREQEALRNAARHDYEDVRTAWDSLGNEIADRIQKAIDASKLNEAWYEQVGHWLDDHLQDIHEILASIGTVLSVASLIFGWIPGLGQVLLIAAAIVSVVNLVISIRQAALGQKSWGSVALEGAFAVLSLVGGVKAAMDLRRGASMFTFVRQANLGASEYRIATQQLGNKAYWDTGASWGIRLALKSDQARIVKGGFNMFESIFYKTPGAWAESGKSDFIWGLGTFLLGEKVSPEVEKYAGLDLPPGVECHAYVTAPR